MQLHCNKNAESNSMTFSWQQWQIPRDFQTNGNIEYQHSSTDSSQGEIDPGFSPYDSLESLVSYEQICCCWVRRFPLNAGIKEGYPP